MIAALLVVALVGPAAVAAAGTTSVSLSPTDETLQPGETATFDVVVEDVDGGVGAYTATVAVDDPSAATITDIELHGTPQLADVEYADDNSSVTTNAALMDTDDTGEVTIATVTVEAGTSGTTGLALAVEALGDEAGNSYEMSDVSGATLTVADESDGDDEPAVSVTQTPTTESATPGDEITFQTTIDATDLNAPGIDVDLPDGWTIANQSSDGGEYKASEHQWVWLSGGEHNVTYTVEVPSDADAGEYDVAAEGSAIDPQTGDRLTDSIVSTVSIEDAPPQDGDGSDDDSDGDDGTDGDDSDGDDGTDGDDGSSGDDGDGTDDQDGEKDKDNDHGGDGDEGTESGDEDCPPEKSDGEDGTENEPNEESTNSNNGTDTEDGSTDDGSTDDDGSADDDGGAADGDDSQTTESDETDDGDESQEDGAGFGTLIALFALIATGAFAMRRVRHD